MEPTRARSPLTARRRSGQLHQRRRPGTRRQPRNGASSTTARTRPPATHSAQQSSASRARPTAARPSPRQSRGREHHPEHRREQDELSDKPSVAVDNSGGTNHGNVYVCWTRFVDTSNPANGTADASELRFARIDRRRPHVRERAGAPGQRAGSVRLQRQGRADGTGVRDLGRPVRGDAWRYPHPRLDGRRPHVRHQHAGLDRKPAPGHGQGRAVRRGQQPTRR